MDFNNFVEPGIGAIALAFTILGVFVGLLLTLVF